MPAGDLSYKYFFVEELSEPLCHPNHDGAETALRVIVYQEVIAIDQEPWRGGSWEVICDDLVDSVHVREEAPCVMSCQLEQRWVGL